MKCLYYLTSTLKSAQQITGDLHNAGINDWFIHVMSKDDAGLKTHKIHSSNYLEQLDILRFGIIGAIAGCLFGIIAAILVNYYQVFDFDLPNIANFAIVVFFTLFGTWEGGLAGIATENKKHKLFHDELEKGNCLILIYTKEAFESIVKELMHNQHKDVDLVAVDVHFYNPLKGLQRI